MENFSIKRKKIAPYTNNLLGKIENMNDEEFKTYLLKKINGKLYRPETWAAIVARLEKLHK